jgi:uncharacterized protein (UPF0335 family)
MRFKLLRGLHCQREPHPDGEPCRKCDGTGRIVHLRGAEKTDKPCTYCLATGKEHYSKEYNAKNPALSVVESQIDLEVRFGREKFQNIDRLVPTTDNSTLLKRIEELEQENARLKEDEPEQQEEVDLGTMTVKELREFAEQHEVELSKGLNKDQMIEAIQSALALDY